jgi:hypothetical protein
MTYAQAHLLHKLYWFRKLVLRNMQMQTVGFSKKLLAASLVGLTGLMTMPVQATVVTNVLTATATTSVNGGGATTNTGSDPAYISKSRWESGGYSSTGAAAWGNAYGTYFAGANGEGKYNSTGQFKRAVTLTNDNGFATDYSLTFFIYGGAISANSNGATGSGSASYNLSIKQDDTTRFASSATIGSDDSLSVIGTSLSGAAHSSYGYYSWSGTYVDLDLGTLAAGASTTLYFDLLSNAHGNFDEFTGDTCWVGETGEVAALFSEEGRCTGSSGAGLGDPNDFAENTGTQDQFVIRETRSNGVPVPGSLPLLGLGLMALAYSRKFRLR